MSLAVTAGDSSMSDINEDSASESDIGLSNSLVKLDSNLWEIKGESILLSQTYT